MKQVCIFSFCLITATFAYAQGDTTRMIEPGQKTSYDNKDLLLISLAGLALLLAIYFLFRRTKGTRN
jgi:hypothetical protein